MLLSGAEREELLQELQTLKLQNKYFGKIVEMMTQGIGKPLFDAIVPHDAETLNEIQEAVLYKKTDIKMSQISDLQNLTTLTLERSSLIQDVHNFPIKALHLKNLQLSEILDLSLLQSLDQVTFSAVASEFEVLVRDVPLMLVSVESGGFPIVFRNCKVDLVSFVRFPLAKVQVDSSTFEKLTIRKCLGLIAQRALQSAEVTETDNG